MISQQTITITGQVLTVYGLKEYQTLPKDTPVAIMFALHGRLHNQSYLQPVSEALCSLNNKSTEQKKRHIIVVTFDSLNHGFRLVDNLSNYAWKECGYANPNHAFDMWNMIYSTSRIVSELIDVIEHYLFGPTHPKVVEVWGVLGFSLGGHAVYITAANDRRITVAISVVGTSDVLSLLRQRVVDNGLSEDIYLPLSFQKLLEQNLKVAESLRTKHLLMLDAEKDPVVKTVFNQPLINSLRNNHIGKEGHDWAYYLIKEVGHVWCDEMVEKSVGWCEQWMLHYDQASE